VPTPRPNLLGDNSVVLTLMMALFVALSLVMRRSARYFHFALHDMLTVRTRENAFDERTINEDAIVVALNIAVAISGAILLYASLGDTINDTNTTFLQLLGLSATFIAAQYAAYALIGYVFTTRNLASQLVAGFSSIQSYLGIGLMLPAAAALFYPAATPLLVASAIVMYVIGRICFICKGFRIFYDNIFSLLYFILYLCSAEIIPFLLVYRKAAELCC
jgi:hypothetical protein